MMLTQTTLEPGKSLEFSAELEGEAFSSIKDKVAYMKGYLIGSLEGFSINPDGYETGIK